ncbi:MAG: hypothetical protein ACFFCZ_28295 [Promethearchaeota archaeon]
MNISPIILYLADITKVVVGVIDISPVRIIAKSLSNGGNIIPIAAPVSKQE